MATITVGLAGITGKFGRLLASHLLKNPIITLRGYARDTSKVLPSIASHPSVTLFQGGAFDTATITPFVTGCDVVVCAYLGDDQLMVEGQKALIDAAEIAGVARYVASDWSLDYRKLEFGQHASKEPCKHVMAYLETKERKVKGVHIMVGGFTDVFFSPFLSIWDGETRTIRYYGDDSKPCEVTSYDNAAEWTAAIVADSEAVGVIKVLGDSKTMKDLAVEFESVYGEKPKLQCLGTAEELYAKMHAMKDASPADYMSYIPLFYLYYWMNGFTMLEPGLDNERFSSVKPVTYRDFMTARRVDDLAKAFNAL
ncbi:hypothetical protein B0T17DRAFT_621066 [Bombardia bombarda]|uniref:NAD(P)-binding domain-containing protein n=1 Tax=Bombardia bombarda TaxID=252184 RepID=A0AA39TWV6_9PEZI|nr:hypothetical protein B0T17DRAFT_621066 [Bombardia bombarda]